MTALFQLKADGRSFPYFYHPHNCGLERTPRRTERTVELALADAWLAGLGKNPAVEVGAVSPYYWPGRIATVIDPADPKATHRASLFEGQFHRCNVLSISTLEHVGEKRYGLDEQKNSLDAFLKILQESERMLVTVPYGWKAATFNSLQGYLIQEQSFLRDANIHLYVLNRKSDETWGPQTAGVLLPYGSGHKPWANTLLVIEKGGLLN